MSNLEKYYINGEWVLPLSKTTMNVINPANEKNIGKIILANELDVNFAVEAAKSAFPNFSQTSKEERLELLKKLLDISKKRLPELAKVISLEMGAPITMSLELQADAAVGHLEGYIEALINQVEREKLANGDIQVREPVGICGLITPWNWPVNQIALKVLPALAAGCTCVLKPSEFTPLSSVMYSEMVHEAGFPPGVFNMIQGDGPIAGASLSKHPDIGMMSFTGSTRAGSSVSKDAADSIKRVALELGGKSPNIVFSDCDLEERILGSIEECYINTGQSCDAPTRLIVERSCYEQVLKIAKSVGEAVKVGDPLLEGDHLGPLVSEIQYGRVQAMIEKGIKEGATLLVGGLGKPDGFDKGYWVRPTIFSDANNKMAIAQEEIFGPVLTIIPFDTEEEAIEIANDTPYGLAAYIQSGDLKRAERIANKLRVGMIHINGGGFNYGSPFGGYKQSGNGREGGILGIEDFQEVKTLHYPE
ncbi:aldehyde dehydrogenase family protein [Amylibacter sp.]|jgi:aldehyde dehydrogenase (NAD+)|nr:aldehyde dehydrogenase family protein [Amylibacter sp.]MDC3300555.1 aldehyde dehydrogenase family protein [bacterium]MDA9229412.1 aldehyde dehydrogenase family protein [Amylibacter sp.]MDA9243194.1 aldehyde dehydrogenase family protein [Amylibacter sp.]MDB4079975.1 aldehyde dehydrogenase family protein [Amylibacter sp.]|tara:strand:+ start:7 stop:1434 length:1428 start_codon:yes stop_codon:yes gene_type:complete